MTDVSGRLLSTTLVLVFAAGFALASLVHLSPRYCDEYRVVGRDVVGPVVTCVEWSR